MRKKRAPKREVLPDSRYNSELMSRLINMVMSDGKKATAEKVVYKAMDEVAKKVIPGAKLCNKYILQKKSKLTWRQVKDVVRYRVELQKAGTPAKTKSKKNMSDKS